MVGSLLGTSMVFDIWREIPTVRPATWRETFFGPVSGVYCISEEGLACLEKSLKEKISIYCCCSSCTKFLRAQLGYIKFSLYEIGNGTYPVTSDVTMKKARDVAKSVLAKVSVRSYFFGEFPGLSPSTYFGSLFLEMKEAFDQDNNTIILDCVRHLLSEKKRDHPFDINREIGRAIDAVLKDVEVQKVSSFAGWFINEERIRKAAGRPSYSEEAEAVYSILLRLQPEIAASFQRRLRIVQK